ncbi:DASH complex subunit dad4 [Thamnocephalis sphaerospora]|uniref:DASH complex subunit DAD4 n=1 Tax=Thamnocephalis sphaerospora TaxID=78915 RepID=A0A4V1IVW8_9FUNG|nr:DASH complex subunit dad4 [Thamnocephalis sphaerospora]|eukprot:RKP05509.1 DASH complex subunit dad4 [Thamnocephalis sphaerospora]
MENPHEEQQSALIRRVIHNVKKLNEVLEELNDRMKDINECNRDIVTLSKIWGNYSRNVMFNLETTDALQEPI